MAGTTIAGVDDLTDLPPLTSCDDDDEEECPVCFESLDARLTVRMPCGHETCLRCLARLHGPRACPLCRKALEPLLADVVLLPAPPPSIAPQLLDGYRTPPRRTVHRFSPHLAVSSSPMTPLATTRQTFVMPPPPAASAPPTSLEQLLRAVSPHESLIDLAAVWGDVETAQAPAAAVDGDVMRTLSQLLDAPPPIDAPPVTTYEPREPPLPSSLLRALVDSDA